MKENEERYLDGSCLIPPLVFRIERDEPEDEQVEAGGHNGEPEEDEDEDEGHVLGLVRQGVILLERHHVPEPDGGERDETVVDGVEVGPAFVLGEGRRTPRDRDGRDKLCQICIKTVTRAPFERVTIPAVVKKRDTSLSLKFHHSPHSRMTA